VNITSGNTPHGDDDDESTSVTRLGISFIRSGLPGGSGVDDTPSRTITLVSGPSQPSGEIGSVTESSTEELSDPGYLVPCADEGMEKYELFPEELVLELKKSPNFFERGATVAVLFGKVFVDESTFHNLNAQPIPFFFDSVSSPVVVVGVVGSTWG